MQLEKKLELEKKLKVVICRLIYLQDLVSRISTFEQISQFDLNKISIASDDVCNAYIGVMHTVGIGNDILKELGFNNCNNIKNIQITPFLHSLNAILASDISDDQRRVLVSGANAVHILLNADNTLKNANQKFFNKKHISGFELLGTFVMAALTNSLQFATLGYLVGSLVATPIGAAQIGAVFGVLFAAVNKAPDRDLAQAKYALARIINVFQKNIHAYTYDMYEKDLVHSELAESYPAPSPLRG